MRVHTYTHIQTYGFRREVSHVSFEGEGPRIHFATFQPSPQPQNPKRIHTPEPRTLEDPKHIVDKQSMCICVDIRQVIAGSDTSMYIHIGVYIDM